LAINLMAVELELSLRHFVILSLDIDYQRNNELAEITRRILLAIKFISFVFDWQQKP